jgi:hypothetical protein
MKNMSILIKFYFPLILLFFSFTLFSQQHSKKLTLKLEIEKSARKHQQEINFQKAQLYFFKKEWDSTLIYSMKQLSSNTNRELADYCYYFRASSFKNKKMFNEAKKEYNKISFKFLFYYHVKLSLAQILLRN